MTETQQFVSQNNGDNDLYYFQTRMSDPTTCTTDQDFVPKNKKILSLASRDCTKSKYLASDLSFRCRAINLSRETMLCPATISSDNCSSNMVDKSSSRSKLASSLSDNETIDGS